MERKYYTAEHIGTGGEYEPQRTFNFTFLTAGPTKQYSTAENLIAMSLYSLKLPKLGQELITVEFGNEVRKVAGKISFEAFQMQCVDYVDKQTAAVLYDWKSMAGNPRTGRIGHTGEYKAPGTIILFAPNGAAQRTFECIGVWPREVDHGEGNMSTNDKVLISVTFEVDRICPDMGTTSLTDSTRKSGDTP